MSVTESPSSETSVFRRWTRQIRRTDSGVVATQSAQIAAIVAVGTLVVGSLFFGPTAVGGVVGGLCCGLLVAVSVATIRQDHILSSVFGGLGVLVSGGLAGGVLLAGVLAESSVAVFGLPAVIVGFGVACFWVAGFGNGAIGRTLGLLVRVSTILVVAAVAVGVVWIDLQAAGRAVSPGLAELFEPTTESAVVAGFVVVGWLAVGGIWTAVLALPPASAVPESIRQQYQTSTDRLVSNAAAAIGVGTIIAGVLWFVSLQTGFAVGLLEPTLGRVVESPLVRGAFVRLGLAGLAVAVLVFFARTVGAAAIVGSTRWSSSGVVLSSGLFGIAVLGAGPLAETVVSVSQTPDPLQTAIELGGPTAVGLLVGVAGIGAIGTVLFGGVVLAGSGVVPSSSGGPRLAAGGLLVMASVVATVESSVWVGLASAVAAIVVWNVALYGVGVQTDLGSRTAHRDGQQIHAVATLVVGGLTAAAGCGFYWLIADVRIDEAGVVVAVVVTTAVLVGVSVLLRRH